MGRSFRRCLQATLSEPGGFGVLTLMVEAILPGHVSYQRIFDLRPGRGCGKRRAGARAAHRNKVPPLRSDHAAQTGNVMLEAVRRRSLRDDTRQTRKMTVVVGRKVILSARWLSHRSQKLCRVAFRYPPRRQYSS